MREWIKDALYSLMQVLIRNICLSRRVGIDSDATSKE